MNTVKSPQGFFGQVMDRMLGLQPVVVTEPPRMQNLAQKRMHIRAAGVREGFQAMRARSEAMTQRLAQFERQRYGAAAEEVATEPSEAIETIELKS